MRERLLLLVGVILLAGAVLYAERQGRTRRPAVVQPSIPFNHQKHIAAGFKCAGCHVYVNSQPFAGIPTVQECLECHASWRAKTPELSRIDPQLKAIAAEGKEIPWQQVHRVQPHVYFSHQRHVTTAKLDCAVCHGEMKYVTRPVDRQTVPINMERCLECHRKERVTTDCLACHR
ncbi:MAG: cytochrome c3 family protein [Candidatus Omnitrophica bacterium]|nr:cytochrome c3 family protein [Candidatus Omnitrophota bacterium]